LTHLQQSSGRYTVTSVMAATSGDLIGIWPSMNEFESTGKCFLRFLHCKWPCHCSQYRPVNTVLSTPGIPDGLFTNMHHSVFTNMHHSHWTTVTASCRAARSRLRCTAWHLHGSPSLPMVVWCLSWCCSACSTRVYAACHTKVKSKEIAIPIPLASSSCAVWFPDPLVF
jgi:hypothetical protein